ncbi:MAG: D-hexose-6-phosphate mutarotase, partial [Pseudomonadales bacterium]|nr:D-hexose-6-phosphate mutarotase [Pseudomonadales bacterium]
WVEKSQRLSQFPDDAWQQMICIETARVLDDMLVLAPGQHHEMAVRFMTTPL